MLTINEENVIAIKPANIEFLKNDYQTKKSAKTESIQAVASEPIITSAPATEEPVLGTPLAPESPVISPPTNADILANEFAVPGPDASNTVQQPEAVVSETHITDEAPKIEPFSGIEEPPKINGNGNAILDIINDITRIQGELDAIGEKVVLLSTQNLDKANDLPQEDALLINPTPPLDATATKEAEIIPFTPAGENIFDQPAGPSMAA